MKKTALFLAIVLCCTAITACDSSNTDTTSGSGSSADPAQSTGSIATSDTDSAPAQTTAPEATTTENGSTPDPTYAEDPGYPEDEVYKLPGGKVGDTDLEGYEAAGFFETEDGKMTSESKEAMFVVTNDRMSAGRLEATFTSLAGSAANDNGIVFGMEDITEEGAYYYWERPYDTPRYYFLFVSDAGTLYLAKVACGTEWIELAQSSSQIDGYDHGGTITIAVEFDGNGNLKCYADDVLLIEYNDPDGPRGDRYGIRCEVAGVVYHSVTAVHAEE